MKDNMNVNSIEDYIVEGTNVSELLRLNKAKMERNKEAKLKNRYITITSILVITIIISFFGVIVYKINQFNSNELDNCMVNHTRNFCMKGM